MLIVISYNNFFDGEAEAVNELFYRGLQYFHLRKPDADRDEISDFISKIDKNFHSNIVIHSYYKLLEKFSLKGIHLKYEGKNINSIKKKSISCHSFEEIKELESDFDYYFLSPIFDSISKENYKSNFSENELENFLKTEKNKKIIALGGINIENISNIYNLGFSGAAVLGYLWEDYIFDKDLTKLISKFDMLQGKSQ